jgi:hypothetical protein
MGGRIGELVMRKRRGALKGGLVHYIHNDLTVKQGLMTFLPDIYPKLISPELTNILITTLTMSFLYRQA